MKHYPLLFLSLFMVISWAQDKPAGNLEKLNQKIQALENLKTQKMDALENAGRLSAAEYRQLHLWRGLGAAQAKHGALLEIAYTLKGRVRLGLGYNFSRFSDNELGDLERDSHGLFLRLVGTY